MKAKWYSSTFIFILALIGFAQQQFSVPNQEIVVQFSNTEVAQLESKKTLSIVKEQLQSLGVQNIKVARHKNGNLKITYFSDLEVAFVKRLLVNKEGLNLGYTSIYNDKTALNTSNFRAPSSFQLDVFEIQKRNDKNGGFNSFALELKPEIDRFHKTVVYFSSIIFKENQTNNIEKVAYTIQKNTALTIENTSLKIPEGRAGPLFI